MTPSRYGSLPESLSIFHSSNSASGRIGDASSNAVSERSKETDCFGWGGPMLHIVESSNVEDKNSNSHKEGAKQ